MPMLWSIKAQEIRAGGFTLRFGAHQDDSNTSYMQVTGKTEGHQITFNRDGEVLSIKPIVMGGEPFQQNAKAPPETNKRAADDAAVRASHDARAEQDARRTPAMPGLEPGSTPSPVDTTGNAR